ncbi:metallophosphoesterase family protein [Actinacidiphila bryophytorum]|uniref:3',5'-cyclic-nucleotide phosphodiesterase n=1 Tax=Actinacidiphila bryophytorum TaxID=1436133 RepID=A0A9W4H426_9ACTN|nr:metallophosphoesterase [Actinacidiphila bryophytorum]MBM9435807.1 metallophosphoesterase [Actinacidiphila bryophytorum]MBN6541650.1 metallophosphoesterase [Actinacidiphila bryophytorum]CAG7650122.1 3',5'-cyclic-nucleotide phosphodiesterase [Actinacidiphila bryophytorum]
MRILHLSDTHLDRSGGPDADGADGTGALRRLLAELGHLDDLDAVVVTGDVADDGSREAYARASELLSGYAGRRGAEVFYTTGNHDERIAFADVLGSGHVRPETVYGGGAGERAGVSTVGGWRLITLDTLVPGKGYGRLDSDQLDWLRELLVTSAPAGTVLAFHHPPVALDVDVQRALGLQNSAELAETIRGTDVQLILCGHFHLQILARLEQATVWVTPGVVSRIDLTARPGTERAVRGPSASLVNLGAPHGPLIHTLHARDPRMGETVYEANEEEMHEVIARLGPAQLA